MRKCPVCKKNYCEPPAISRIDNHTKICPICGTKEALENLGMSDDAEQIILNTVKRIIEPQVEIYTVYSQEADITFILENKGKTTRLVGFYYGEPDDEATCKYYGKLIAEFD